MWEETGNAFDPTYFERQKRKTSDGNNRNNGREQFRNAETLSNY